VWVTFSNPELATAGLSEQEARAKYGNALEIFRVPYDRIDRAVIDDADFGMCKIICDAKGYIVGAHILGARAGELIHEIQIGKAHKIKLRNFYSVLHAYPTYSELLWHGARQAYIRNLQQNIWLRLLSWILAKTGFKKK